MEFQKMRDIYLVGGGEGGGRGREAEEGGDGNARKSSV